MRRFLTALLLALVLAAGVARAQNSPTPAEVESARSAGASEGERVGRQEGESRGNREGDDRGFREGRDRAYRETCDMLTRRAYDDGLRDGRFQGTSEGQRRGEADGRTAGLAEGRVQGEKDGDARARRDSEQNAAAPAAQAGRLDAEASDAQARGRAEGTEQGDAEAKAKAREVDYPRGRAEYFQQRSAEPVKGTGPMKTGAPGGQASSPEESPDDGFVQAQFGSGGGRYRTPEENSAWQRGYNDGYQRGNRSGYDRCYRESYDRACGRGRDEGRRDAERRDYSFDRRRGYDQGYREQYDNAYASFRATAFNAALAEESARVSASTFNLRYQGYYEAAFARLKDQAYRTRFEEIRTAAREAARQLTMARNYPDYAKAQHQQGRVDEKADLAQRPLRIVTAGITTPGGGPPTATGQPLQLNLSVRNFGETKYAPGAMTLEIVPAAAGSAYLPVPRLSVTRDFPARVVLAGRGLAELQVRREFADQDLEFAVRVLLDGRLMDTRTLKVKVAGPAPEATTSPEPTPPTEP